MKSLGAWIRGGRWSAYGASAFLPNAWPAWRNSPDRAVPGLFPPEVVVQIKALACELPSQHQVPLARWSVPEIARQACQSGLVATISDTTVGAGCTKMRLRHNERNGKSIVRMRPATIQKERGVLKGA